MINMQTAPAGFPPPIRNQIAMQQDETIAKPAASPSSPSIRLKALMIPITHTAHRINDTNHGSSIPQTT